MVGVSPALRSLVEAPDSERKIGAFVLVRQLGRGGFAPVWLAREVYGERELRTAAVKLFALDGASFDAERPSQQSDAARHRDHVIDEAESLCKVEHPNVVRFYALLVDEARGVIGLAMEFVNGEPLDRTLEERGKLSAGETIEVGVAVASALAAVHEKGLVHRDVKPANVVASKGVYKLIDFGIAAADAPPAALPRPAKRVVLDDLPLDVVGTKMSMLGAAYTIRTSGDPAPFVASGTVGYIDPVCVASGEPAVAASDLYGLGALLFECVTGKLPALASAPSGTGLRGEVLDGRTRAIAVKELAPDVPEGLARIIDGLLAPDRAARPASAAEVARSLASLTTSTSASTSTSTSASTSTSTSTSTPKTAFVLAALAVAAAGAFFFTRGGAAPRATIAPSASARPDCAVGDVAGCTADCDAKSPTGCNNLALMYLTATSVPKDLAKARDLYAKACGLGHVGACQKLGAILDGEKDHAGALALFERGCDAGSAQSCQSAASIFAEGRGVAKDAARAADLLRQACDAKYWGGCASLGVAYERGEGVALDLAEARRLYELACDNGAQAACANLGLMYAAGRSVEKDEPRAAKLYQQACDGDYAWACQGLGVLYENGSGVAKDESRAATLYARACDKSEWSACTNLARLHAQGRGVPKNDAEALRFYTIACDKSEAHACAELSAFYATGRHVARDLDRARSLAASACDAGAPEACAFDGGAAAASARAAVVAAQSKQTPSAPIVPPAKAPSGGNCGCAPGDLMCMVACSSRK